jgi:hypothetical protein
VNHPVQQQGQTMAMVALPAVGRCSFAQWKEAALLIRATWPGQVFPDPTVLSWWEELRFYESVDILNAVRELRRRDEFRPSCAALIAETREARARRIRIEDENRMIAEQTALTVEEKAENERLKRECLARLDEFAAKKALVPDDEFQRFAARRALRRQELRRMGETLAERERELAARRSETG